MPHFMIVLILYINLLNLSWIIKCVFLMNMEPLRYVYAPHCILLSVFGRLCSAIVGLSGYLLYYFTYQANTNH